jgi:hypothetical protein
MNTRVKPPRISLETNAVYEYLFLVCISLLALAVRFYRLGEWSFWGDEVFSLSNKDDGFLLSTSVSLIKATTAALGTSEWTARLAPAAIGVISIPILYFPTRQILGVRTALIAGMLLAVSTWHLYWSQNARFYTLLLLLYTFALLLFYLGIEKDKPWFMVSALILFGLATKERLLALFFVPVVLSYIVLLRFLPFEKPSGFRLRNLAIFFVPCIVLGILFAIPFISNLPAWLSGFGRLNNNPFWLMGGTLYYIGIPTVILGAFSAIYFLVKKNRAALLFSLGALIPLYAIMAISLVQYTANRYIFVSLTSWIFLAAMGVNEIFIHLKGNTRVLGIGVLALLLVGSLSEDWLYFQYQHGNRDNWKAAFNFVKEQRDPDDLIISANPEVGAYYLGESVSGFQQLDPEEFSNESRIWLVEDMTTRLLFPEMHAWMVQNARLVANFDNHLNARVYTMRVYFYEPSQ